MPSILLVTNDFGPRAGGIETFVIGLLERVPAAQVLVYTSFQEDAAEYDLEWLQNYQVEVIRDKAKVLLPTPRVVKALRKLIKTHQIETVWFGAAAPLAVSARWLKGAGAKRMIALTHGHEVWWSKLWPFSIAIKEIARQLDHVTYLGAFTKKALEPRFVEPSKLIKIAPGIDTNHFKPNDGRDLRAKYDLAERPVIISVGRLVHRKGQDRLVEALPKVLERFPEATLVFVGEGPHRKVLDELVAKNNLQNNVLFIGRIRYEDLPKYISMGDIFAMPSRSRLFGLEVEGLGIVYLEASACGLPVIGGASGGAPDAVIDGKSGFVVDGNDLDQISNRCIQLLESAELRLSMGRFGREWVEENWRWEIWSKRFNELLELKN